MTDSSVGDSQAASPPMRVDRTAITDAGLVKLLELLELRQAAERDARSAWERAREQTKSAREAIHRRLDELAIVTMETGERPLTEESLWELYWDWPEVNAGKIGAVMGIRGGDVHKVVGPSAPVICRECGTTIDHRPASRATPGTRTSQCEPCRAESSQRHLDWINQRRRDDAEHLAALRRGGYWITGSGELLDPSHVSQFIQSFGWCHCRGGGTGDIQPEILNRPSAWHDVLAVHYRCQSCGYSMSVPLARYVEPVRPQP